WEAGTRTPALAKRAGSFCRRQPAHRWKRGAFLQMGKTGLEEVEERLQDAEDVTWGPFSKLRDALKVEEKTIVHNAAEAADKLGTIISSRSGHFTGEPPYAGWEGLLRALKEDYDELDALRAAAKKK